jgi:hypothetical protein
MSDVVARLDDIGKPAWIGLMVLGFILFWPVGLLILAYMIWSGRMACGRHGDLARWQGRMAERWERNRDRWERHMERRGMRHRPYGYTGNRAFDEYRAETLRRLEEEADEFREFLGRLRMAKDKAEFDQFMAERRTRSTGPDEHGPDAAPTPQT